MKWSDHPQLKDFLENTIGLEVLEKPQQMQDYAEYYVTAIFSSHGKVALHYVSQNQTNSEIRKNCRKATKATSQAMIAPPCLVTCGSDANLGILAKTGMDEEAFQFLNLKDLSPSDKDILKDLSKAKQKTSLSEKIEVAQKALDYEALSKKFFESAEESKDNITQEIVRSMKLSSTEDKQKASHYAIVIMARMIFLHFLERKSLLNHESKYIKFKVLEDSENDMQPQQELWQNLFSPLFEVLSDKARKKHKQLKGQSFPYLNGGLFQSYRPLEDHRRFSSLKISDEVIRDFHKDCLYKYRLANDEENQNGETRGVLDPELLGTIFERFMKDDISLQTGSVYTPKDIVLYMIRNTLSAYFESQGFTKREALHLVHHKKLDTKLGKKAQKALDDLKLIDPCCGSGAFLLTGLQELYEIQRVIRQANGLTRWHNGDKRRAYESILQKNIYGIDINPEAIVLCHLRLWLPIIDLIDKRTDYAKIEPLPNLDLNIREGNAITNLWADWKASQWSTESLGLAKSIRKAYFKADYKDLIKLKKQFDKACQQDEASVTLSRNFIDIIHGQKGFDVVVGNPPYLGYKKAKKLKYLKKYIIEESNKEINDLYIMATLESYHALKTKGVLSFITSKTYFTDSGKEDFRSFLMGKDENCPLSNLKLTELSTSTFSKAVHPAIFSITKASIEKINSTLETIASKDFSVLKTNEHIVQLNEDPSSYELREVSNRPYAISKIPISQIEKIPRNNFFFPTAKRRDFLDYFLYKWHQAYQKIWPLISTSRNVDNYSDQLQKYTEHLKPGDLTLIGAIANGGQGIATGCNAIHLACMDGTKQAQKIKEKMAKEDKDMEKGNANRRKVKAECEKIKNRVQELNSKGLYHIEAQRNYVHKIIAPEQILKLEKLSPSELEEVRENGISDALAKKYKHENARLLPKYVPYYKGQNKSEDSNRWFTEQTYFINWSQENVKYLQKSKSARWQGFQYFFRQAFGWNLRRTIHIKARLIDVFGIQDVNLMSLKSEAHETLSDKYLTAYLNQDWTAEILEIITLGEATQINDIKKLPVLIPRKETLNKVDSLVDKILNIKKSKIAESHNKIIEFEDQITKCIEDEIQHWIQHKYKKAG